MEKVFFLL